MTGMNLRGPRTMALAAFAAVGGLALLAERVGAQAVAGKAYGTYVNALGVRTQSPVATLPSTGGMSVGDAETFGAPNTLDARWLKAVTTGAVDNSVSSAQSTSELENVSVLGGLIKADGVTGTASSYRNASGAASDAAGSGFVNLLVNGVPVTDVAPNTRVALPGVGYAVLNEQQRTGDGVTTSGITVNMIHVVLQSVTGGGCSPLMGCLPEVTMIVGEIVVGSASSAVR